MSAKPRKTLFGIPVVEYADAPRDRALLVNQQPPKPDGSPGDIQVVAIPLARHQEQQG